MLLLFIHKLCPTLCDPMDCSTPASSVFHYLQEFVQIRVHRVSNAIQPSHLLPLLLLLPLVFPSIKVFSNESTPHQVAKVITKVILYIHIYKSFFFNWNIVNLVLCWFLVYSRVFWLHIYIYSLSF